MDMFETLKKHRIAPEAERELAVIDRAVANGDAGRPEDAELTDFAMKLRSTRPLPDVGEIARLDARIAETQSRGSASDSKSARRSPMKLALAGLGVCFVVGMVGISLTTFGGDQSLSTSTADQMLTDDGGNSLGVTESAPETNSLMQADGAELAPESTQQSGRVQTRSTDMLLVVENAELADASDGVIAATDRFGGYVSRSNTDIGEARSRASLELMIPAVDYEAAVASISALGHVKVRSQSTEDITAPFRRAESSLGRAIKTRNRLSRQRRAATTAAERDALTFRLRRAIRRVAAERQKFNALERQSSFVAMRVSILGDDSVAAAGESTLEAAWRVSKDLLTKILAALIVALAVLAPFAILGGVAFGVTRSLRRRRNDGLIEAVSSVERSS